MLPEYQPSEAEIEAVREIMLRHGQIIDALDGGVTYAPDEFDATLAPLARRIHAAEVKEREDAIEEAAKVCDVHERENLKNYNDGLADDFLSGAEIRDCRVAAITSRQIAADIRALGEKNNG